ncbi:hypothetical protein BDW02DRAFT_577705 [Decorospora gaudefroyi]|uniref:Uncharacterized protein n=1 Tax=Decorospora gaudefroyi TaxID=184978 RepID=A0A6A5KLW5_9PLEO|nr:hypothetical protein BDW02DRAFT_577705 [Decorospora gaudefroyi]
MPVCCLGWAAGVGVGLVGSTVTKGCAGLLLWYGLLRWRGDLGRGFGGGSGVTLGSRLLHRRKGYLVVGSYRDDVGRSWGGLLRIPALSVVERLDGSLGAIEISTATKEEKHRCRIYSMDNSNSEYKAGKEDLFLDELASQNH